MAVGFSGFPVTISARRYPQGVGVQSTSVGQASSELYSTKTPWPMSTAQETQTLTGRCVQDYWYRYYDGQTKADVVRKWPRKFVPGSQMNWCMPIFYGATAEHYNGKIYIFGGYKRSGFFGQYAQRRMWSYEIATNTITDLGDQPLPTRYFHGSCVHNGKMWIFGGKGQSRVNNDLWAYDFESGQWEKKAMASPVAPRHRFGRKLVVINNKFYVWGGMNESDVVQSAMSIYDVATDTWADGVAQGSNPPSGRADQAVWEDQGRYYMALGTASEMWSFDPAGGAQLWTQVSAPSNNKSYSQAFVHPNASGSNVFIVGADNDSASFPSRYTYRWNSASQSWVYGLPWVDAGTQSACYVDGKIYNFGSGYNYGRNHISYFDCDKEQWFRLDGGENSWGGRTYHSVAFSGRSVYITGGRSYANGNEVWDTNGSVWEANIDTQGCRWLGSEGFYRQYARMGAYDGKLFLFGGKTNSFGLSRLSILDIETKEWSVGSPLPETLWQHTAQLYNGKFYVFGGQTDSAGARDRLWEYDPVADTWTEKASAPRRMWGHEAYVYEGKMYVVFGRDENSASSDLVYVYTFATNSWSSFNPDVLSFGRPVNTRYQFTSWGRGSQWYILGDEASNRSDVWYLDLSQGTPVWMRGTDNPRGDCRDVQAACDPATGRGYLIGGPTDIYRPTIETMTCYF